MNIQIIEPVSSSLLVTADAVDILQQAEPPSIPLPFETNLPWFSKEMNISDKVEDYFFRPTPIIVSDLPNRNGVGFPAKELARWNLDLHCRAFEGWRFCPMFEEHRSDDIRTAIGVVADVVMRKLRGFGNDSYWLVVALTAIDRTKNVSLAAEYESGRINTVSMGAMVNGCTCSYCGAEVGKCSHIDPDQPVTFYELNGRLVYKQVYGVSPYELSVVRDPAYGIAIGSDNVLSYKRGGKV